MRHVLIPYQQDLVDKYELTDKESSVILNERYISWINSHPDMVASVINYDDSYLNYLCNTDSDLAVLLPGGYNIGDYPERDLFEFCLVKTCLDHNIPLLGVCKGMQLINVVLGGSLKNCKGHWQGDVSSDYTQHIVFSRKPFTTYCGEEALINSFHNQALDNLGKNVCPCGYSDDVVECIIVENKPVIGVQWHPSLIGNQSSSEGLLNLFYSLNR